MRAGLIVFSFVLIAVQLAAALRSIRKCRIIALEGGGTKGAYQAGAFEAMAELMEPEDIKYDVITGASVGSLNGLMIAAHEKGEEKLAAKKLTELWRNIRRGDILQNWGFPGPMRGFYDRSFFDNTPELHLLQRKFKEYGGKLRRRFTLGITDAQTGDYIVKNQDVGDENIPHYILASSSVPGIFPYIVEGSHVFIDGGTVNNLNLRGGIEECYKLGAEEEDIVIDLIMTNPLKSLQYDMSKSKTYDVYQRGSEMLKTMQDYYYLLDTMRVFAKAHWRYLIIPKVALPNYPGLPLSFDPERLKAEWEMGKADATEVVKKGKPNLRDELQAVDMGGVRRINIQ